MKDIERLAFDVTRFTPTYLAPNGRQHCYFCDSKIVSDGSHTSDCQWIALKLESERLLTCSECGRVGHTEGFVHRSGELEKHLVCSEDCSKKILERPKQKRS